MKKIYILPLILFFCLSIHVIGQRNVSLHHNGTTTIYNSYNPFIDAYNNAITGDTIYLSGGSFSPPATFDKEITIIGAGCFPDSTVATNPTVLTSSFTVGPNADNIHFEGLEFSSINKLKDDQTDHITIIRCAFSSMNMSSDGTPSVNSTGMSILQSLMGDLSLSGMINSTISNSVFHRISYSHSNLIQNNISLYDASSSSSVLNNCTNNNIINNIFNTPDAYIAYSGSGNMYYNNIFTDATPNLGSTYTNANNYFSVTLSTVYVSQPAPGINYNNNYHLQASAASTYLGNDNTQVGIYGGFLPFKEGMVPQNPHIISKNISSQTDNNGDLNIQLNVGAQNE